MSVKFKPINSAVTVVVLLGVVISFVIFMTIRRGQLERLSLVFQQLAKSRTQAISRGLDLHRSELDSVHRFYEHSAEVTESEFILYTEPLLEHPCVQSMEWIPLVRKNERAAFEQRTGIQIRELDADGQLVSADERAEYFPIELAAPFTLNKAAIGFDLGSNPMRRTALESARDQGEPSSMELLRLVENPSAPAVFMAVYPVYQQPSESLEKRRRNLRGFVLGMYRVEAFVEHTMKQISVQGLAFLLEDLDAPPGRKLLHRHDPRVGTFDWSAMQDLPFKYEEILNEAGRSWRMTVLPNNAFIQDHLSRAYWWILPGGLLLTVLVALLLHMQLQGRQRAELLVQQRTAALRESEAQFRGLIESSSDWIWEVNTAGVYTYSSPQVESILGYKPEDVLGKSLFDLMPPDEAQRIEKIFGGILDTCSPIHLLENVCLHKDGRRIALEKSGVPVIDSAGKGVGYRGMDRDITERKQAEEVLAQERRLMNALMDNSPDRIYFKDTEGRFLGVNRAVADLFDIDDPSEVIGKTDFDFHPKEHAQKTQISDMELLRTGCSIIARQSHRIRPDGLEEWVSSTKLPLRDTTGRIIGMFGISRDVTKYRQAEEALRESERKLSALMSNLPGMAYRSLNEKDWPMIFVSSGAIELTGYTPADFMSQKVVFSELILPEDAESVWEEVQEGIKHKRPYVMEYRIRTVSGQVKWIWEQGVGIFSEDDQLLAVEGLVIDITERKQTEEDLRESRYRLLESQSVAQIGSYVLDIATGTWESSPILDGIFGIGRDYERSVEGWKALIHPDDRQSMTDYLSHDVIEEQIPFDREYRIVCHDDQTERWVIGLGRLEFDDQGRPVRMIGTIQNITERKKAEEEKERLLAAINQAVECIVITDIEGNIQYVNPAFERITGYTREEAVGQNPRILKSGEQDDAFYQTMWKMLAEGKTWRGLFSNRKKDGTLYTEEATISPVKDSTGKIINYVAIKEDVTIELAREKQYRQSQKMESVGRLAGGVAHDFNNILQTITGFCGLILAEMDAQAAQRQDVVEIQKAAQLAGELTQQLLTFSRKKATQYAAVDLNTILNDGKKMVQQSLDENFHLELKQGSLLKPVTADASQILQVAMNLVVNARDAMPDGGTITLCTQNMEIKEKDRSDWPNFQIGEWVCFSVSDTGCGMDEKQLAHLFEPFYTTKGLGMGTGLGLSVVYGIVEEHGGWIHVDSEPGNGTSFKICLPVSNAEESDESGGSTDYDALLGKRILLVEDDPMVRQLTMEILQGIGYVVSEAADASEAKQVFSAKNGEFDLLFSDIGLPGQNGIQLAEFFLKQDPELSILLFSGHSDEQAHVDIITEKGFIYVRKPFNLAKIVGAVSHALTGHKG